MIIRMPIVGNGTQSDPNRIDLPIYQLVTDDPTVRRAFVDVPSIDVPADVAAFVAAYPVSDLIVPLPQPFPSALARSWREHLARRYDLGNARWGPEVA